MISRHHQNFASSNFASSSPHQISHACCLPAQPNLTRNGNLALVQASPTPLLLDFASSSKYRLIRFRLIITPSNFTCVLPACSAQLHPQRDPRASPGESQSPFERAGHNCKGSTFNLKIDRPGPDSSSVPLDFASSSKCFPHQTSNACLRLPSSTSPATGTSR